MSAPHNAGQMPAVQNADETPALLIPISFRLSLKQAHVSTNLEC